MTQKNRQEQVFTGPVELSGDAATLTIGDGNLIAGSSAAGSTVTPNTNVATTFDRVRMPRHVRLTLSGFTVSVAEADDYGGTKLCDLPDENLVLLAVEADLELVKGEVTNGLEAATDVTVAIGTAVASNSTLSGAMVDVITGIALTATDASPAFQIHSSADGTLSYPILLADGASAALYLNAAASITADDALTVSGTIDLFFVDVGNVTS